MRSTVTLDRAAAVLSLSCVAHCVALPVLAISLPFLAAAAEAEWIHQLLTVLAVLASASVIGFGHGGRRPAFLVPALVGISLVVGALFVERFGLEETIPTLVGGVILASAHIYRLTSHR